MQRSHSKKYVCPITWKVFFKANFQIHFNTIAQVGRRYCKLHSGMNVLLVKSVVIIDSEFVKC